MRARRLQGRGVSGLAAAASPRALQRYLGALALAALALAGAVLGLNRLVDPLWHFEGNRITGVNLVLNERVSKTNRLLAAPDAYDCLIFGTSRSTLIHTGAFTSHRCFNLAFSAGRPAEFEAFARYLAARGVAPEVVYVAIDARNMRAALPPVDIPAFIAAGEAPRHWLVDYLSIDAALFSLRTLFGASALVRRYDAEFEALIGPHNAYRIPEAVRLIRLPFERDAAQRWAALADIFPQARVVGYVPPIAGWLALRELGGRDGEKLDIYLSTLRRIATVYDEVVDFSAPSAVTLAEDHTYDGSHYDLETNARIARRLEGAPLDFGLVVTPQRMEKHRDAWTAGLAKARAQTRLIE